MNFEQPPTPKNESVDETPLYGEDMINHCLETGTIPQDISMETFEDLIMRKTPENTVFKVAEERYRVVFEERAKNFGRKDVKFILENKG